MSDLINNKRALRVRKKLKKVNFNRYRLSVFRSLKNISAQIIDDRNGKTLISASSTEKNLKKEKIKKRDFSVLLGETLAKRALEKKQQNKYEKLRYNN